MIPRYGCLWQRLPVMGHAGAIVSGSAGTAQAKKDALEAAGVRVGKTPSETATLMREIVASL